MPFVFKDGSVAGVCKVCGNPSRVPRSNVCDEHYDPSKAVAKKKKSSTPPTREGEKALSTKILESAGEVTSRTFGSKAPSAKEWEEKLTGLLVLGTLAYVEFAIVNPLHAEPALATRYVEALGMTEDEARTITEPISFVLAKTKVSKDHGREALELLAFAPAMLAILAWTQRVAEFRRNMNPQATPVYGPTGGPRESSGRTETTPATPGPAVVNFGGPGAWEPDQAPTAGVDASGDRVVRTHLG